MHWWAYKQKRRISMEFDQYTILHNQTILDALKKINTNKKGFIIVLQDDGKVMGTLTDGDIRRALINGYGLDSIVSASVNTSYKYMSDHVHFDEVIDIFKDEKIDFLPVITEVGMLYNIITKDAMNALLLQDIHPKLDYKFLLVDGKITEHAIQKRPWGFYKTTILNDRFQSKIISINPLAALSFQKHKMREEHWVIVHGNGEVRIEDSVLAVKDGSYLFIPKGCKHRIINTSNENTLIMMEVQCGEYFGEDDIYRYEDVYGRK